MSSGRRRHTRYVADEPSDSFDLRAALIDATTALTTLGSMLDDEARTSDGLWKLDSAVRQLLRRAEDAQVPEDAEGVLALRAALDAITYRLSFEEGRCLVVPYLQLADGTTQPLEVNAQSSDVVNRWRGLLETTTHEAWRSRLGHLLVASESLVGRKRVEVARAAIDDYLALPWDWGSGLDSVDALRAALALARQFRLDAERARVLDTIAAAARASLAETPEAPGIVLRLTQTLVDSRDPPADVDAILEDARTAYADNIHNLDQVIEQQLVRGASDQTRAAALWAERVRAWLHVADSCGDIRRAHFLQIALEHASRSGDKALRQEATSRLQEMTLEDLKLQGISTGMVLRGEDIARSVRSITESASWQDALDAFAVLGPPTGDVTENRRVVDEHAREFVLSKLFPVTQYGSDGLPRFSATTDDERAEYDLTQQETFHLQFQGHLVAEALLRFPAHHPLPTSEELTEHFARNPLVDRPLAAALARSFLRWWAGDHEGAGFTVAPRIEALARNLLLATNAPLYRLQRERAPGQYPGLGFLLEQLRLRGFPESWYRYLFTVLANSAGWNARNELAHGFLDHLDLVTSALLLQCAANLALALPTTEEGGSDIPPAASPDV